MKRPWLTMATIAALAATPESEPVLIGSRSNKIVQLPLVQCVTKNQEVNAAIHALNFQKAMELRGSGFQGSFEILRTLVRALPHPPTPGQKQIRFAILNAGGAALMRYSARSGARLPTYHRPGDRGVWRFLRSRSGIDTGGVPPDLPSKRKAEIPVTNTDGFYFWRSIEISECLPLRPKTTSAERAVSPMKTTMQHLRLNSPNC